MDSMDLFAGGRPPLTTRSSSQGGVGATGNKYMRSKGGNSTRNESNRISAAFNQSDALPHSKHWVAGSTCMRGDTVYPDSPEIADKKVLSLLNKLIMEKIRSISNQVFTWANKSEIRKDGRSLIWDIRLVSGRATDEAVWSEMYARSCRNMMSRKWRMMVPAILRTSNYQRFGSSAGPF